MKSQNLFATLFAILLLSLGSVTFADGGGIEGAGVTTVNVNEADAATIANTLVGVGFSRAKAIVQYREEHGKFYSPEELTAVKGIGEATVNKNLMRITTE